MLLLFNEVTFGKPTSWSVLFSTHFIHDCQLKDLYLITSQYFAVVAHLKVSLQFFFVCFGFLNTSQMTSAHAPFSTSRSKAGDGSSKYKKRNISSFQDPLCDLAASWMSGITTSSVVCLSTTMMCMWSDLILVQRFVHSEIQSVR